MCVSLKPSVERVYRKISVLIEEGAAINGI